MKGFLVSKRITEGLKSEVKAIMCERAELKARRSSGSVFSNTMSLRVKSLTSNNRTVQSAPTVPNTFPSGAKQTSKTSLSCVMTCLFNFSSLMSQIVHVVSMDEQQMMFGWQTFQSKLVSGAASSRCRLFCSVEVRVTPLSSSRKRRRWSEVVAKRSASGFFF